MKYLFSSLEEIKVLINQLGKGGNSIHELHKIRDWRLRRMNCRWHWRRQSVPCGTDVRAAGRSDAYCSPSTRRWCVYNPTKSIYSSFCCVFPYRLNEVN